MGDACRGGPPRRALRLGAPNGWLPCWLPSSQPYRKILSCQNVTDARERLVAMQEISRIQWLILVNPLTCGFVLQPRKVPLEGLSDYPDECSHASSNLDSELGVELRGFEPRTSCMPCKRSTN
jgi:hypothetical protein